MMISQLSIILAATFSLTLTPDRENGRYAKGDTVTYTLAGTVDGVAIPEGQKFLATWQAGDEIVSKTEFTYSASLSTLAYPVEKTGSYWLSLMPLDADGKAATDSWKAPQCGVICDFDDITKPMTGDYFPSDFDAWWDGEVAAQAAIPLSGATRTERDYFFRMTAEEKSNYIQGHVWIEEVLKNVTCYDVRVPARTDDSWIVGGANTVAGALTVPKDMSRKYPAYIQFFGVGWDGRCQFDPVTAYNDKALVFTVFAHGLPVGANWDEDFDVQQKAVLDYAATNPSYWEGRYERIGAGMGRDKFYYRLMFLRAARAVEYVKTLPEWDGKNIILFGNSQGAAQSIAAAALAEGVTDLFIGIPAMCDFSGDANDPKRGTAWPFNTRLPTHPESDYFDCVNFAHRLKNVRIHMAFGCTDSLVPATGPAAFYNALPSDAGIVKEATSVAAMGHDGVQVSHIIEPGLTALFRAITSGASETGGGSGGSQGENEPVVVVGRGPLAANETLKVFEQPGDYEFQVPMNVSKADVLVVGGGGAGGGISGAGGGGGQVVYREAMALTPGVKYAVTVGAGGVSVQSTGTNGGDSKFGAITAVGGGAGSGGWSASDGKAGANGGGAGGNSADANDGGAATVEGGFPGGKHGTGYGGQAGGGGAAEAGHDGWNAAMYPGWGGKGVVCSITGENVMYGPGGGASHGGWKWTDESGTQRWAGRGGADDGFGNGDDGTNGATAGRDGVGGGGGGGQYNGTERNQGIGGNGGCGAVIIRYAVETPNGFMLEMKW